MSEPSADRGADGGRKFHRSDSDELPAGELSSYYAKQSRARAKNDRAMMVRRSPPGLWRIPSMSAAF